MGKVTVALVVIFIFDKSLLKIAGGTEQTLTERPWKKEIRQTEAKYLGKPSWYRPRFGEYADFVNKRYQKNNEYRKLIGNYLDPKHTYLKKISPTHKKSTRRPGAPTVPAWVKTHKLAPHAVHGRDYFLPKHSSQLSLANLRQLNARRMPISKRKTGYVPPAFVQHRGGKRTTLSAKAQEILRKANAHKNP